MSGRFRFLVTGSREWDWRGRDTMRAALLEVYRQSSTALLIHGGARGADRMAGEMWRRMDGDALHPFKADWSRYGAAAGPIRNRRMLDEGKPALVLAFFASGTENRGTTDAVGEALRRGIEVRAYGDVPASIQTAIASKEKTCG